MNVKIKRIHPDAVIPQYAHEGDSGFDLVAIEDTVIEPGETKLIRTGLAVELPPGYELQVRPRSGITLRTKLRVQLGTVDSNYRGEIGVIVDNIFDRDEEDRHDYYEEILTISGDLTHIGDKFPYGTYIIRKGEKIAQAVIKPVEHAHFTEVGKLDETERGSDGFGSTGTR